MDFKETNIDYISTEAQATFSSSEKKWINKISKLRETHPTEVEIIAGAEENYGVLLAHIPKTWIKISPPRKINYTDEQRAALSARMKAARSSKVDPSKN